MSFDTTAQLCERATRACAEARQTAQETKDAVIVARAGAAALRRLTAADDLPPLSPA